MRILLIAHQSETLDILNTFLSMKANLVDTVEDSITALNFLQDFKYDLVIISSVLHNTNRVVLCKKIRASKNKVPILILAKYASAEEQILGLDAGADEFLIDPLDVEHLNARIRVLLRRSDVSYLPLVIEMGSLSVDLYARSVTYHGKAISLRPKEFSILELFVRNPDRVFSRDAILQQAWDYQSELPEDNTVKSHIRSLRMSLKIVGARDFIETVYGVGYRLNSHDLSWQEDCYTSACA